MTQAGTIYTQAAQSQLLVNAPKEYGIYSVSVNSTVVDSFGIVYFLGYATEESSNIFGKVNPASGTVTRLMAEITGSMAINSSGEIYILDTGSSFIKKWSASTQQMTLVVSGINGSSIAVDRSNNLYVADTNAGRSER